MKDELWLNDFLKNSVYRFKPEYDISQMYRGAGVWPIYDNNNECILDDKEKYLEFVLGNYPIYITKEYICKLIKYGFVGLAFDKMFKYGDDWEFFKRIDLGYYKVNVLPTNLSSAKLQVIEYNGHYILFYRGFYVEIESDEYIDELTHDLILLHSCFKTKLRNKLLKLFGDTVKEILKVIEYRRRKVLEVTYENFPNTISVEYEEDANWYVNSMESNLDLSPAEYVYRNERLSKDNSTDCDHFNPINRLRSMSE